MSTRHKPAAEEVCGEGFVSCILVEIRFSVTSHLQVGIIQRIVCIIHNKILNHHSWMLYSFKVLAVVNSYSVVEIFGVQGKNIMKQILGFQRLFYERVSNKSL